MAFKPPQQFDFSHPEGWSTWRQRFLRYRTAAKLTGENFDVQVSALLYSMGEEAEKIYGTFTVVTTRRDGADPPDPPLSTFDDIIEMFDRHFTPRVNVIHERAKFHQRYQSAGENIETFVRALYDLAEHAAFDNKDTAIRDRLVVGLHDRELSEKLQLQPELTLDQAITQARQHEQIKTQMSQQRSTVDAVHSKSSRGGHHGGAAHTQFSRATVNSSNFNASGRDGPRHRGQRGRGNQRYTQRGGGNSHLRSGGTCGHCGREPHRNRQECPARGKVCRKCGIYGHFANVCRQQQGPTVNEVETHFLGSLVAGNEPPWLTHLHIGDTPVRFKIDTGADVSVISLTQYTQLCSPPPLQQTHAVLSSPAGRLNCKGYITAKISTKKDGQDMKFFVVDSDTDNLLGRTAACQLNLVQRIDDVSAPVFGELDQKPVQCTPVKIQLKEDAQPYSLPTARRVPIPLEDKVKAELERMKAANIIEEITEPTDWCAPMVAVMKKSGAVRICTDLKKLNLAVKRERYIIPTIDDILHRLKGSKVFTKLDATSGFWQIPLDPSTAKLTTFISPFGRFYYKRLPFGITSAPEIFQRTMEEILQGINNVVCFFDDILIHSSCPEEHEKHIATVLQRLEEVGLKLNKGKSEFRQKEIEFLGHHISGEGIRPSDEKVEAIRNMPEPKNITELKRILGMINFLGRFIPSLSTILRPMTALLEKDKEWLWGEPQKQAFSSVKAALTSTPTLTFFDLSKPTMVSSDASSYGIGGVLLQEHNGIQRPVAYCSRTLTPAERAYAQIEKECLAAVWACEKFSRYLVGLPSFKLQTDHKPLVPLINSKDLQDTPLRCQRLLMRMMRFNPTAVFAPGKDLVVADTLSRSPQDVTHEVNDVVQLEEDVAAYIDAVRQSWPVSDEKLREIATLTSEDRILQKAISLTSSGWPASIGEVDPTLREFYSVRSDLSVNEGLLIKGSRIVIPEKLREDILSKIHAGHLGITKCRERAAMSVWWPGISSDIAKIVRNCTFCEEKQPAQQKEPLLTTPLPERPFQQVAADLFQYEGQEYLVLVDYYSRYLEISHLPRITTNTVVGKLKNIFAHHGIPELLVTDNGRQFTSSEFKAFSQQWQFRHTTSSPYFSQSNGEAERAVREAKKILSQKDPMLALLVHRATPTAPTGVSPAELLMSRPLRTTLPTLPENLNPRPINKDFVAAHDARSKQSNKFYYDRRHGASSLPKLHPGDIVLQKLPHDKHWNNPARVIDQCNPRSYIVETSSGSVYRRNRWHLKPSSRCLSIGSSRPELPHATLPLHCGTPAIPVSPVRLMSPVTAVPVMSSPARSPAPVATSDPVPVNAQTTQTSSGRVVRRPARLIEEI